MSDKHHTLYFAEKSLKGLAEKCLRDEGYHVVSSELAVAPGGQVTVGVQMERDEVNTFLPKQTEPDLSHLLPALHCWAQDNINSGIAGPDMWLFNGQHALHNLVYWLRKEGYHIVKKPNQ